MSKPTVSAAGGAMPAEGRPSHAQTATKIGDELDIIKALVDAAYMASNELTDFHREAMRRLLDETSSKVGWVQKEFTEIYCGGYIDVGKREPAAAASRTPAGKGADDSTPRANFSASSTRSTKSATSSTPRGWPPTA